MDFTPFVWRTKKSQKIAKSKCIMSWHDDDVCVNSKKKSFKASMMFLLQTLNSLFVEKQFLALKSKYKMFWQIRKYLYTFLSAVVHPRPAFFELLPPQQTLEIKNNLEIESKFPNLLSFCMLSYFQRVRLFIVIMLNHMMCIYLFLLLLHNFSYHVTPWPLT